MGGNCDCRGSSGEDEGGTLEFDWVRAVTVSSNAQVRTEQWIVIKSPMNENRNLRVGEHFDGFAAQDDCRNAAASM